MTVAQEALRFTFTANNNTGSAFRGLHGSLRLTDKISRRVRGNLKGLGVGVGSLAKSIGGVGALAGGLSLTGAIGGAKAALNEFDALAKQARIAGISTDLFQGLQLAFEEEGVSQEKLNRILNAFTTRIGEAKFGRGELFTTLKKLNPELLRELQITTDMDKAILRLSDATQAQTSADQRAAVAKAAFSRAGLDAVEVFRRGSVGILSTTDRLKEMNGLIGGELLTNSENLANRLGVAQFVLERRFKQTLIDLAPTLVNVSEGALNIARSIEGITTSVGNFFRRVQIGGKAFQAEQTAADLKRISDTYQAFIAGASRGTADLSRKISQVPPEIGKWQTSIAKVENPYRRVNALTDTLAGRGTDAFRSLAFDGESLRETLRGIAQDLAVAAFKFAAIRGLGAAFGVPPSAQANSGFFGSLFAGGFASGGFIPPGQVGLVGERGAEFVAGGRHGKTVFPSGGGTTVNINMPINATGAQAGVADELRRTLPVVVEEAANRAVQKIQTESRLRPGFKS